MRFQEVKFFLKNITLIGIRPNDPIYVRQRIVYFNTLIFSLPIVYFWFVLYSIEGYLRPISEWYFDQYGFFLFSLICAFCFGLNYLKAVEWSKAIFIISWPLIQHVVPIIIQTTPTDYYFAYPMGMIFYGLMIQVIYSSKYSPVKFGILMTINFLLTVTFLDFLQTHDTEGGSELRQLAGNEFYVLVVVMYWLLFNLVIFYIMRVIESHMVKIVEGRQIVETQKKDLQSALNQLKASNDLVVQSEKMASLGIFTSGIAHELNNPLNYIGSGTDILFSQLDRLKGSVVKSNPDLHEKFLEMERARQAISDGVDRSSKIIRSLKNYARKDDEQRLNQNVMDCIHDAILLIPSNLKNQVTIEEELPERLMVNCSANKLTQVFVNLIQNAIDASSTGDIVHITAFSNENEAIIEVKDHGAGIKKKERGKIFDPFFTTKKVGEGTGLGLYIVHDIIKEHKGNISVSSKLNNGTTFKITLPLGADHSP